VIKMQEDMDIDTLTGILPLALFNSLHLRFLGTGKSTMAGIILRKINVKYCIDSHAPSSHCTERLVFDKQKLLG
jgi:hypothetical protein